MPTDEHNRKRKILVCLILFMLVGTIATVTVVTLASRYHFGQVYMFLCSSTTNPIQTLVVPGDYVLLNNINTIRKCPLYTYSVRFTVNPNFTTEVFSIPCNSIDQDSQAIVSLSESSTVNPLLTQLNFRTYSKYNRRVCILDQFVYQALTDDSIIRYIITLDVFVHNVTKVQIVAYDNLEYFDQFLKTGEIADSIKHVEMISKSASFVLMSADMRSSSYYFFAIEDVSNTSENFTVNRTGTHIVNYNISSLSPKCTLNAGNRSHCEINVEYSSHCFFGHVLANEIELGRNRSSSNPRVNLQPTHLAPTDLAMTSVAVVIVGMLLIPLVVFVTVAIILRIRKKIWNASGLKSKKLDTACHESSELIEFDEKGRCYTCSNYGVTIIIPEGAVRATATLQYKASFLSTDFKCESIYYPVSPILWIHADCKLLKEIEVYIPHYAAFDDENNGELILLTRGHDQNAEFKKNKKAKVVKVSETVVCVRADHFCSLCLAATKGRSEVPQIYYAMYAQRTTDSDTVRVDICVLYSFRCQKIVTEYYENRGYEVSEAKELDKIMAKDGIEYSVDSPEKTGWTWSQVGFDPQTKITPNQVDVFKVLNCDEQNITDEKIEQIKSLEESGSYPPRFRLRFHPHPESKHDRPQLINITLYSSKGTLPLALELNGKFKEPYEGASGLEQCYISDSATNFHKTIPFLESLLKNNDNFLNFSCDLGLRRDEAVAINSRHGYNMKLCLQEVITKCEQESTMSLVDITKALAKTGVVECNSTSQYESDPIYNILCSLPSHSKLTREPEFDDLENHIAAKVLCDWEVFGIQIKVSYVDLKAIKREHQGMRNLCFHDLFGEWKKSRCSPFTWSTVLAALCSPIIKEYRVAKDLCFYLQEHKGKKL